MTSNNTSLPTPAEILAQFYEAETKYMAASPEDRDFASGMGRVLSPNLRLYQSPDLPYSQSEYHGHEGFQVWSEEMANLFSGLVVSDPNVFELEGSDEVVVSSTLKLKTKEGGRSWEAPLLQIMGVDRKEGVITSIRPFYWDVEGLKKIVKG